MAQKKVKQKLATEPTHGEKLALEQIRRGTAIFRASQRERERRRAREQARPLQPPIISSSNSVERSRKVLVLPHAAIVAGLWQPQSAGVALTAESFALTQPVRSSFDLLAHRRQSLGRFAATILHHSPMTVSSLRSMQLSMIGTASAEAVAPAAEYTALEGLGALIVNEKDIDRMSLQSTGLGTVLDNVLIPMVPPLNQKAVAGTPTNFWHQQSVEMASARAKGLDGSKVLVGVLDTGIDPTHPEFAGKTIHFQEYDQNGAPVASKPHDAGIHGTHVCGLIGGLQAGLAPQSALAVACVLTIPAANGLFTGSLVQIAAGVSDLRQSRRLEIA